MLEVESFWCCVRSTGSWLEGESFWCCERSTGGLLEGSPFGVVRGVPVAGRGGVLLVL